MNSTLSGFNRNFTSNKVASLKYKANSRKLYTGHFDKRSFSNMKETATTPVLKEEVIDMENCKNIIIPNKLKLEKLDLHHSEYGNLKNKNKKVSSCKQFNLYRVLNI